MEHTVIFRQLTLLAGGFLCSFGIGLLCCVLVSRFCRRGELGWGQLPKRVGRMSRAQMLNERLDYLEREINSIKDYQVTEQQKVRKLLSWKDPFRAAV